MPRSRRSSPVRLQATALLAAARIACLVGLAAALGSVASFGETADPVAGTWESSFVDGTTSGTGTLTLVALDDGSLRGTWVSAGLGSGALSGALGDRRIELTLTRLDADCPGEFEIVLLLGDGAMAGDYTGSDCHGSERVGVVTLTRPGGGSTLEGQPTEQIIEYGDPSELASVRKVFVETGGDLKAHRRLVTELGVYKYSVEVVTSPAAADAIVVFYADTFSAGSVSWLQPYRTPSGYTSGLWGFSSQQLAERGSGTVLRMLPGNTIRVLWQFEATRRGRLQSTPEKKFVRRLIEVMSAARTGR